LDRQLSNQILEHRPALMLFMHGSVSSMSVPRRFPEPENLQLERMLLGKSGIERAVCFGRPVCKLSEGLLLHGPGQGGEPRAGLLPVEKCTWSALRAPLGGNDASACPGQ